jgi:dUTP pyrophosphatase
MKWLSSLFCCVRRRKTCSESKLVWHLPADTDGYPDLTPRKGTPGSIGYDFVSPIDATIAPGEKIIIDTLVVAVLPQGYGMILGSRSGLAAKHGITVEAGWIDNDFLNSLGVVLYNHSTLPYVITKGDRIAQGMLVPIFYPEISVKYNYPDRNTTIRGAGGFGSTGR